MNILKGYIQLKEESMVADLDSTFERTDKSAFAWRDTANTETGIKIKPVTPTTRASFPDEDFT